MSNDEPYAENAQAMVEATEGFQFGNAKLNDRGFTCCGKPIGCTMTHEGCAYRSHPWKREHLSGRHRGPSDQYRKLYREARGRAEDCGRRAAQCERRAGTRPHRP